MPPILSTRANPLPPLWLSDLAWRLPAKMTSGRTMNRMRPVIHSSSCRPIRVRIGESSRLVEQIAGQLQAGVLPRRELLAGYRVFAARDEVDRNHVDV